MPSHLRHACHHGKYQCTQSKPVIHQIRFANPAASFYPNFQQNKMWSTIILWSPLSHPLYLCLLIPPEDLFDCLRVILRNSPRWAISSGRWDASNSLERKLVSSTDRRSLNRRTYRTTSSAISSRSLKGIPTAFRMADTKTWVNLSASSLFRTSKPPFS